MRRIIGENPLLVRTAAAENHYEASPDDFFNPNNRAASRMVVWLGIFRNLAAASLLSRVTRSLLLESFSTRSFLESTLRPCVKF